MPFTVSQLQILRKKLCQKGRITCPPPEAESLLKMAMFYHLHHVRISVQRITRIDFLNGFGDLVAIEVENNSYTQLTRSQQNNPGSTDFRQNSYQSTIFPKYFFFSHLGGIPWQPPPRIMEWPEFSAAQALDSEAKFCLKTLPFLSSKQHFICTAQEKWRPQMLK